MTAKSQMHGGEQELAPVQMPASQVIFKKLLFVCAIAVGVLALVGSVIGFLVAGQPGLIGAFVGALFGGFLMALSLLSIVFANKQIANPLYVQIFFGAVLGTLLVKMVLFLVVVFLVREVTFLEPKVLYVALIAGVLLSLAIDLVVLSRNKMVAASDVKLYE